jgi:hypothetical protein
MLRGADSLLQYQMWSATVLYSTLNYLQVKNLKANSAEAVLFRLKNHCYGTVDSLGLEAGQSASTDTVQQRKHRKNLDSQTVRYSTLDCPRIANQQEQRA